MYSTHQASLKRLPNVSRNGVYFYFLRWPINMWMGIAASIKCRLWKMAMDVKAIVGCEFKDSIRVRTMGYVPDDAKNRSNNDVLMLKSSFWFSKYVSEFNRKSNIAKTKKMYFCRITFIVPRTEQLNCVLSFFFSSAEFDYYINLSFCFGLCRSRPNFLWACVLTNVIIYVFVYSL